jgi:hypothetical protein
MKKFKYANVTYYSEEKLENKFIEEINKFIFCEKLMQTKKIKEEKGSRTRTLYKTEILGEEYFLKKFTYKKKRQCLRLNLGLMKNKALQYLENPEILDSIMISNVRPSLVIVHNKNILNYECILVTKNYCQNNNGMTYREFLKSTDSDYIKIRLGVKLIKDMLRMLENNFHNHDFGFDNFLVINKKLYYLDLESAKVYKEKNNKNKDLTISIFRKSMETEVRRGVFSREVFEKFDRFLKKEIKKGE